MALIAIVLIPAVIALSYWSYKAAPKLAQVALGLFFLGCVLAIIVVGLRGYDPEFRQLLIAVMFASGGTLLLSGLGRIPN